MDEIKVTEIGNGVRLHAVNTSKFKTTTIAIFIHNNIDESATLNSALSLILRSGCRRFSSRSEISKYLEEMYGAVFETDVIKKGEIQSILLYFQFIGDRYAGRDSILSNMIDFAHEIMLEPLTHNGEFNRDYVSIEKQKLYQIISSRINDRTQYALDRCLEVMCENEPFSIYRYGDIKKIDEIDAHSLYSRYEHILKANPIDIYVVGDIGTVDVEGRFKDSFKIEGRKVTELWGFSTGTANKEVRRVTENMDVTQGKLCLGFRYGIPFTDHMYPAMAIYSSIFGGGMHSKLFKNVREKEGLAYYAYSGLEKYKALMAVNCGIDADKYDRAVNVIMEQADSIRRGDITGDEIDNSIKKITGDLKGISDHVPQIIDYDLGGVLYGMKSGIDEMVEAMSSVTKNDVIEVAQNVKLDTVYFLKPSDRG